MWPAFSKTKLFYLLPFFLQVLYDHCGSTFFYGNRVLFVFVIFWVDMCVSFSWPSLRAKPYRLLVYWMFWPNVNIFCAGNCAFSKNAGLFLPAKRLFFKNTRLKSVVLKNQQRDGPYAAIIKHFSSHRPIAHPACFRFSFVWGKIAP